MSLQKKGEQMKVETIKGFVDKSTKEQRLVGNVFDCDEERAVELETAGYVKMLEKRQEKKPAKKSKAKA